MISKTESAKETVKDKKEWEPELAFYERLSSKKNEVKKQWQVPQKETVSPKKTSKPNRKFSLQQDQTTIDPGSKKPVKEEETRATAPDLFFTIQLASLNDADTAESLADRLNRKGYAVYYYEVEIKGRVYYRVRCGRYTDKEEAEKIARRLAQKEGIEGFVTALD